MQSDARSMPACRGSLQATAGGVLAIEVARGRGRSPVWLQAVADVRYIPLGQGIAATGDRCSDGLRDVGGNRKGQP